MFRDLYAAELEYMHGLSEALGREQSRLAPMLGRDADPGVSRLVQGVAFLSARLRQRLDDDLPDVVHPVIESLCPWLLRPLPSATLVELTPHPTMKEPQVVRAGSGFASRPVDGSPCLFRSTRDIDVRPWALSGVGVDNERTEVSLQLTLLSGAAKLPASGSLTLFFALPSGAALDLRSALLRTTASVVARASGAEGGGGEVSLASEGELVGGGAAAGGEPADEVAAPAWFALRAWLAFPEQFAFVTIPNLERLAALGDKVREIEIALRLRAPLPPSLRPDAAAIRLHCVPAINVRRTGRMSMPLVRGRCALAPRDADVYMIEKVSVVRENLAALAARPYASFFPPPIGPDGHLPFLYRVARRGSVLGPELDLGLEFLLPDGGHMPADATSVDVELLVTDGERASRVGIGEVCVATPASPPLASFRNITPVTRTAPPAVDGDRLWRWFQVLRASFDDLADRDSLVHALALANVAAWARWPGAKPGAEAFEAVLALRASRRTRPGHDELFPGAHLSVDVDVERFAGSGDIDLFGERLAALFASTLRPHEWVELTLHDASGATLFEYPTHHGTREVL